MYKNTRMQTLFHEKKKKQTSEILAKHSNVHLKWSEATVRVHIGNLLEG